MAVFSENTVTDALSGVSLEPDRLEVKLDLTFTVFSHEVSYVVM